MSGDKVPVIAWGFPNSRPCAGELSLMSVRLEIPSDDQYGGALWIPLVLATDYEAAIAEVDLLRKGIVPRGDDMIVPIKLLDEINASGSEWKSKAEAAIARSERAKALLVTARDYVSDDLLMRRDAFKGFEHLSYVEAVEADLAAIDSFLRTDEQAGGSGDA